ncbi:MAG: AAA family ATPase [Bacteroidia bacterium]|nr:AAA family ATPase [Bacteroidia bacterium]
MQPTHGQLSFMKQLADFLLSGHDRELFILKGYAGTGKTSLVKSIIKTLPAIKMKSVLLAPTGRAAKVLGNYSGKKAQTIHSKIYKVSTNQFGGMFFALAANPHTDTLFIVDEASMIQGEDAEFGKSSSDSVDVLSNLLEYVFSGENCRLLFIGDVAQLPPVGLSVSPALNPDYLKASYYLNHIQVMELTEVARQSSDSMILADATKIRRQITEELPDNRLDLQMAADVMNLNGENFLEKLNESYARQGHDETVIITRSNKRANQYNQGIRARVLYRDDEIGGGDILMVVRNNYFWLPADSEAGFIANGDFVEVQKIRNFREMHGHRFATATLRLMDYPGHEPVECTIMLDVLTLESPNLGWEASKKLYESVSLDYQEMEDRRKRAQAIRNDPYLNALQVKFGYAITCHKAQGGQWDHVYLDHGWIGEEYFSIEFYRWLYTGFTRAKRQLYLVNFDKRLCNSNA